MSDVGGKAEIICSFRVFRILTGLGDRAPWPDPRKTVVRSDSRQLCLAYNMRRVMRMLGVAAMLEAYGSLAI